MLQRAPDLPALFTMANHVRQPCSRPESPVRLPHDAMSDFFPANRGTIQVHPRHQVRPLPCQSSQSGRSRVGWLRRGLWMRGCAWMRVHATDENPCLSWRRSLDTVTSTGKGIVLRRSCTAVTCLPKGTAYGELAPSSGDLYGPGDPRSAWHVGCHQTPRVRSDAHSAVTAPHRCLPTSS